MDIQLIRTFVEVHRTRHFARAADTLCISQAAVSSRVNQLEQFVGAPVFVRQRNNLQLTAAGERLLPQAEALMSAWNRLLIHASAAGKDIVALGCLPSIGEIFLEDWLGALYSAQPETLLQLELLNSAELLARIRVRSLDAGLLYEPAPTPQITSQHLTSVVLALVCSEAITEAQLPDVPYVQLNWGTAFAAPAVQDWEHRVNTALRIDSPRLARQVLLHQGGAACLPLHQVQSDVESGALHILDFAPTTQREVYLVYASAMAELPAMQSFLSALTLLAQGSTT